MHQSQHKNEPKDYKRAQTLRRDPSPYERRMWNLLRKVPKEMGLTFRRQHPLHPYIADFVCLKKRLVIELDGDSHDARQAYDHRRDDYLRSLGYKVLRFGNEEVKDNAEGIVSTILREARSLNSATPLLQKPGT